MQERIKQIIEECLKIKDTTSPIAIFNKIASMDFIRIHGPEHHILDGAAFLTAYSNAGGNVDLQAGLERIAIEGEKMPGAICGLWGVCGSVASIGAALAFIDKTSPLSTDDSWGSHMEFTSKALKRMGEIGGPRCCKRDAYISLETAIEYVEHIYGVKLDKEKIKCGFNNKNEQCIGKKCPYSSKKVKVAFVCVHNSCRSQMAEALGKKYLSDICECYSAGTETKPIINQDAVRIMKSLYGIDMEKEQYSKLFEDIPDVDIIVSMGCNVKCPYSPGKVNYNWGLEDPSGQNDETFINTAHTIEEKVKELREIIKNMP